MPQSRDEGAGGRVNDNKHVAPSADEGQHIGTVLRVVLLNGLAFFFAAPAVVILAVDVVPHAVPDACRGHVQEHAGIKRAVVHRHQLAFRHKRRRVNHIGVLREHGVDHPVGHCPASQNVAFGEDSRVHRAVLGQRSGGEGQIVGHLEMQIQQSPFVRAVNPPGFEPMERSFRIAVEPPLRALDGAAGGGLIDERLRHERHFVKERPRQRDALNQILGAFVLAAEEVEKIHVPVMLNDEQILRAPVGAGTAQAGKHLFERGNDIPPQSADGLAADREIRAVESLHRPHHEGQRHAHGLAGADRAVGDDAVITGIGRSRPPPCQNFDLFFGEGPKIKPRLLTFHHRRPSILFRQPSAHQRASAVLPPRIRPRRQTCA